MSSMQGKEKPVTVVHRELTIRNEVIPAKPTQNYPIAEPKSVPIGNTGESAKKAVSLTKA